MSTGPSLLPGPRKWWHPRVARTSGSVTEAIYGLILALSVVAVSQEYDDSDAGLIAASVLITGVVFWLAHVYSRVLAASIERRRRLEHSEIRDVLRHDWPLVQVTVPLVVALVLGALGILADGTAIVIAIGLALFELALTGAYAARLRGARLPGVIASATIATALGAVTVALKAIVH